MAIRKPAWKGFALLIGLLILIALPHVTGNAYKVHMLNMIGIYIIVCMGLNLVLGYCGQINLGIGAFWAVGAYTSALLNVRLGWSPWVTIAASVVVTSIVGVLVGLPSFKVRSHYLAIVTLGLGEVINLILFNEEWLTMGAIGISGIEAPSLFGTTLNTEVRFYYLVLGAVILAYLVARQLVEHRVGCAFRAVRDDYVAAQTTGVNVGYYQLLAFALCGAYARASGALLGHLNSYISPDIFIVHATLFILTATLLGGSGHLLGPVIGGGFIVILHEWLRAFAEWQLVLYGAIIVLVVLFLPGGVMGIARRLQAWRIGKSVEVAERGGPTTSEAKDAARN